MSRGPYQGYHLIAQLPPAPDGAERWSARTSDGDSAEVILGGEDLERWVAELPSGGPWVTVSSGRDDGHSWALIPDPHARNFLQLRPAPAHIAVAATREVLVALDRLHRDGRHHGRLHPAGVGFDAEGQLKIRPLYHEPPLADPDGRPADAATDCWLVGGLLVYLLGGSWPPERRDTSDFETTGVNAQRLALLVSGLMRDQRRWRLQPARKAYQAATAVIRDIPDLADLLTSAARGEFQRAALPTPQDEDMYGRAAAGGVRLSLYEDAAPAPRVEPFLTSPTVPAPPRPRLVPPPAAPVVAPIAAPAMSLPQPPPPSLEVAPQPPSESAANQEVLEAAGEVLEAAEEPLEAAGEPLEVAGEADAYDAPPIGLAIGLAASVTSDPIEAPDDAPDDAYDEPVDDEPVDDPPTHESPVQSATLPSLEAEEEDLPTDEEQLAALDPFAASVSTLQALPEPDEDVEDQDTALGGDAPSIPVALPEKPERAMRIHATSIPQEIAERLAATRSLLQVDASIIPPEIAASLLGEPAAPLSAGYSEYEDDLNSMGLADPDAPIDEPAYAPLDEGVAAIEERSPDPDSMAASYAMSSEPLRVEAPPAVEVPDAAPTAPVVTNAEQPERPAPILSATRPPDEVPGVSILERTSQAETSGSFTGEGPRITENSDRETELGAGKWTEEGRSAEDLAREMPDTPIREMDLEESGKSWGLYVAAVVVLCVIAAVLAVL